MKAKLLEKDENGNFVNYKYCKPIKVEKMVTENENIRFFEKINVIGQKCTALTVEHLDE